jgi:hypothetical protein
MTESGRSSKAASAAAPNSTGPRGPRIPVFARAAERFVAGNREGAVLAATLAVFLVLWTLYHVLSSATLDADPDISEVAVAALNFGVGYHHPPLQPWVFAIWFAVFPRTAWAVKLLAMTLVTSALAITWRLLRDQLDRNRAFIGVSALTLTPLYTFLALTLDANTVMMPFWAATLLFYLRAYRSLAVFDAVLAGGFAGLAFLGKFWAVYLMAGMAVASLVGRGTKRFWRSLAPYCMAGGAAIVIAPWFVIARNGNTLAFARDVMTTDSFGKALAHTGSYLGGSVGYVIVPLLLLAALRPNRAGLVEIAWPADAQRQQALLLFLLPLLLPALVNLVFPYRLTPLWTIPNWALLPVVLYASPRIAVDARAVALAGLVGLALPLASLVAAPVAAFYKMQLPREQPRSHYRQTADAVERLAGRPVQLFWGSGEIAKGLAFYMPDSHPLTVDPLSAEGRAEIRAKGLAIICFDNDSACLAAGAALAGPESRTADLAPTRSFLGFVGQPSRYRLMVLPAENADRGVSSGGERTP